MAPNTGDQVNHVRSVWRPVRQRESRRADSVDCDCERQVEALGARATFASHSQATHTATQSSGGTPSEIPHRTPRAGSDHLHSTRSPAGRSKSRRGRDCLRSAWSARRALRRQRQIASGQGVGFQQRLELRSL